VTGSAVDANIWFWVAFNAGVLLVLAVDLFGFHRDARPVKISEAATWVAVWVSLSLAFNFFVYKQAGRDKAIEFLLGYLIEYSLSVDNIFVFVLIFTYFRVPGEYQHRVLFWGVLGALLMRGAMIAIGVQLINSFGWILYIFGVFLIFLGIKMFSGHESSPDPQANPVVRLFRRLFPMTPGYVGGRFIAPLDSIGSGAVVFDPDAPLPLMTNATVTPVSTEVEATKPTAKSKRRIAITPLFLVLVMVETTDLIFAIDSIPAIFAVTRDPFIVYTSNVCAIMGLRALYFLLAGVIHRLEYLKYSLGFVLAFIGAKMLVEPIFHVPAMGSLCVIALALAAGVVISLIKSGKDVPVQPPEEVETVETAKKSETTEHSG
jgi:tellurite resistance protein TerC